MRDSCLGRVHTDAPRFGDCPRCVEAHRITNEACEKLAAGRVALDAARKARGRTALHRRTPDRNATTRRSTRRRSKRPTRRLPGSRELQRAQPTASAGTRSRQRTRAWAFATRARAARVPKTRARSRRSRSRKAQHDRSQPEGDRQRQQAAVEARREIARAVQRAARSHRRRARAVRADCRVRAAATAMSPRRSVRPDHEARPTRAVVRQGAAHESVIGVVAHVGDLLEPVRLSESLRRSRVDRGRRRRWRRRARQHTRRSEGAHLCVRNASGRTRRDPAGPLSHRALPNSTTPLSARCGCEPHRPSLARPRAAARGSHREHSRARCEARRQVEPREGALRGALRTWSASRRDRPERRLVGPAVERGRQEPRPAGAHHRRRARRRSARTAARASSSRSWSFASASAS